jgi:mannitol/fructose-specific phosphotransferase system IIA component (Ntr-type)
MIVELLPSTKILFGLKGDFSQVIDTLSERSSVPGLAAQLRAKISNHGDERFSYIGDGIAVPHLRVDNLSAPELVLGLSSEGIEFNAHVIKIILLLITPAEQPARHLQLLQRICHCYRRFVKWR